jgi:tetratricopeptide (TPR) repeat protein
MTRGTACAAAMLAAALALSPPSTRADESAPLLVPKGTAREQAVVAYNEGVRLMLDKRYPQAQVKFEEALASFEGLAEAHNNLAFSLRMQGAKNFERALKHYDRAIELKPDLAVAYMYRGVLFTQQGDLKRASADHARLLKLDRGLAAQLDAVIVRRVTGDDRAGIAPQYD